MPYMSQYQMPTYGMPQPQQYIPTQQYVQPQYVPQPMPQQVNNMPVRIQMNPNAQTPYQPPQMEDTSIGVNFGSLVDGTGQNLPVAPPVVEELPEKKKSTRKKKTDEPINHTEEVNQVIYADTYQDTNMLLHQTIGQLDIVSAEMKEELDKIMASRTMKGRHLAIGNVSKSLSDMLSTKVQAIKELNNSIKAVNDMEYRRAKDNRSFESSQGDDKAIMDLYNAFIQAPVSANIPSTGAYSLIGPNTTDVMFGANSMGSGNEVLAADGSVIAYTNGGNVDQNAMLNNYLSNLTPEQNAMINEGKTETVVVYDKATGAKSFQVVDSVTMQPVPNMPLPDPMFLSDTIVDVRRKVARNTNLNKVYKVIVTNEDKVSEY
jgi:hypothetical protein